MKDADQLSGAAGEVNLDDMVNSMEALQENLKTMQSALKALSEETRENRRVLRLLADQQSVYLDDDADSVTMPI